MRAAMRAIRGRTDVKADVRWHIAMRPGKRRALYKNRPADALIDRLEKLKAGIWAKVEHPFRVIKRQFGHVKVRYRGLKKNTAQLLTLFALSNLWMVRVKLWRCRHECVCTCPKGQERRGIGPLGRLIEQEIKAKQRLQGKRTMLGYLPRPTRLCADLP